MAYRHSVAMDNGVAEIHLNCYECNQRQVLKTPLDNYLAWRHGDLIQNALADLSPDQREMLISGICPKCWNEIFGDGE